MLLITCPFCGPRAEIEFRSGGEAHIARPPAPESETDDAWRDYLFTRRSPRGVQLERWNHAHGCQRWFNVARDTVMDEILAVYRVGETPPTTLGAPGVAKA